MKKYISVLLISVSFILTSCGGNDIVSSSKNGTGSTIIKNNKNNKNSGAKKIQKTNDIQRMTKDELLKIDCSKRKTDYKLCEILKRGSGIKAPNK